MVRSINRKKIAINKGLQVICLMHGEINNHQDLFKAFSSDDTSISGDLDLSIYLYRRYGLEFRKEIKRPIFIDYFGSTRLSFFILNDRFGLAHQVYWMQIGKQILFCLPPENIVDSSGN